MYPKFLIGSCAVSVQEFNHWLEVKANMNKHLLMCQLQFILCWSTDILLEASFQFESPVILTIESYLQGKDKKDKSTFWHLLTSLWRWWRLVLGKAQNNWAMESKWENSFHSSFILTVCQSILSGYKTMIWIPNVTHPGPTGGSYTCVFKKMHTCIRNILQGWEICHFLFILVSNMKKFIFKFPNNYSIENINLLYLYYYIKLIWLTF